jgi:VanZ family protein
VKQRAWVWWGLLLLWCGIIYLVSAKPVFTGQSTGEIIHRVLGLRERVLETANLAIRKFGHIFGFAGLGLLAWRAIRTWPGLKRAPLYAWLFATLYAASDEWHQRFVPGRTGVVTDVLLDATAAAVALLLLAGVLAWRHRAGNTPT